MLLSEEEVKVKTQLWFAENGDYLKEQEGQWETCVHSLQLSMLINAITQQEERSRQQ